ncbi:MAG: tripartite tricarboxylate transporter substrate binding protein [Reyranellaceae bacterium]
MKRRNFIKAAAALPAVGILTQFRPAFASKWPEREITLINGFAPGAATDLTARALAEVVARKLDATIIVKNVPGGAGTAGPAQLAASKPDGYTMGLVGSSSVVASPFLMDVPYKPWEAFEFIAQAAEFRYGLGVSAESPVKTLEDFIALGKTRQVTFGSTSPTNLTSMYKLRKLTGANLRWIVFKGGNESVMQAVGGHVDSVLASATEMKPQIDAGKLRLLASASDERWDEYPDVKTIREHGYDAATRGPVGYAFPAGVDPQIRDKMEKAFEEALQDKELQQRIRNLGVVPKFRTGKEYHALLKQMEPEIYDVLKENNMLKKS